MNLRIEILNVCGKYKIGLHVLFMKGFFKW